MPDSWLSTKLSNHSDTKQPCSTCAKSHAHSLKLDPYTTPPEPECTYDRNGEASESMQAKINRLEARVAELELILDLKDAQLSACTCRNISSPGFSVQVPQAPPLQVVPAASEHTPSPLAVGIGHTPSVAVAPLMSAGISPLMSECSISVQDHIGLYSSPMLPEGMAVSTTVWPPNIPPLELLRHLADTVFNSVPLASRIIHRPTFMASLSLPPSSRDFPHVSLLHAVCALASVYTPIVTDVDAIDLEVGQGAAAVSAGVYQRGPNGFGFRPGDDDDLEKGFNFATSHLRWCIISGRRAIPRGESLIQQAQGMVLVAWYYHSRGNFVNALSWTGIASRLLATLGLNTSRAYTPLSRIPAEFLYVVRPALNPTEEEIRRNIFWVVYAMERLVNSTNVWALIFEDMDCSQVMPCRSKDFDTGVFVPKKYRQHLHTRNMLITHPPLATDSFTLYIKAAIILGQVRSFNRRYKQYYDTATRMEAQLNATSSPSSASSPPNASTPPEEAPAVDPRESKEFKALDDLINAFIVSIPKDYRDPVGLNSGAKLDPILYIAHLLPYMAAITLHDPHANVFSANDLSAQKLLQAARGILSFIYSICSTTFDLLYLDHTCSTAWFLAGATLTRFLTARTAQGNEAEVLALTDELRAVRFVLANLGDRTGVGLRQLKLLDMVYQMEVDAQARARHRMSSPALITPGV
ncbi:hypothetical protein FRB93_011877 [Tulasnella sp. JGI-2019a]|nr:hypothetical protein FRB93_011877 [Tulasnella sp. JGI-2019a]